MSFNQNRGIVFGSYKSARLLSGNRDLAFNTPWAELAVYAGYFYSQSKTMAKNGQEYFVYDEGTRNLGKIMMALGAVVFLFLLSRKL